MERFKNIEILRIIGCLAIILLHMFSWMKTQHVFSDIYFYDKLMTMTSNGQKAVDLFFMLSGFFFAYKLNIAESFVDFFKKKIIRIYPTLLFCMLLVFFISLTGAFKFKFYSNIMDFLCLNGTSLVLTYGNMSVFWYVSAMLWTFALYLYLFKNFEKKKVNLFIFLTIFFCYTFIIHAKHGQINNHAQTFYNIFNIGMMRALGGIGLGYFIAEWYKDNIDFIKNLILSFKTRLVLTGLEFMCLYFIINNLMLHKLQYKNDMIFIVVFVCIIVLFILKQGFISKYLNCNFWSSISKYTYSLYMTHSIVIKTFKGLLYEPHPEIAYLHPYWILMLQIFVILILGIFTYHFVEKPSTKYLTEKYIKKG